MIIQDSNRKERFIAKLIKDTKLGKVTWDIEAKGKLALPGDERLVSKVYVTNIKDKNLRLYQYQIKHYTDEFEWDWVDRVKLEIFDDDGDTLFEYGYDFSFFKLLNAIRAANTKVDEFMKDFLNE